jgi:N-glycosylase/DNA lyase
LRHEGKKYKELEGLLDDYETRAQAIKHRLMEFRAVSRDDYFYELAYCLLTPQSSAVNAAKAVEALKHTETLVSQEDFAKILFRKEHYIRFHNTKARRLCELRDQFPVILAKLDEGMSGLQVREWLVKNVNGLGWKEASHFLRNVGCRNLAILDRHILRNLERHGVIRSLPKALTAKRYLEIETGFAQFARDVAIEMDELDLLFWSRETGEILK